MCLYTNTFLYCVVSVVHPPNLLATGRPGDPTCRSCGSSAGHRKSRERAAAACDRQGIFGSMSSTLKVRLFATKHIDLPVNCDLDRKFHIHVSFFKTRMGDTCIYTDILYIYIYININIYNIVIYIYMNICAERGTCRTKVRFSWERGVLSAKTNRSTYHPADNHRGLPGGAPKNSWPNM